MKPAPCGIQLDPGMKTNRKGSSLVTEYTSEKTGCTDPFDFSAAAPESLYALESRCCS
jgi:hypothetical protein